MTDEKLEISREKLFDFLSGAFSNLSNAAATLMDKRDMTAFVKRVETIIDDLNHDILENCKREKPILPEKNGSRIEVDWS